MWKHIAKTLKLPFPYIFSPFSGEGLHLDTYEKPLQFGDNSSSSKEQVMSTRKVGTS